MARKRANLTDLLNQLTFRTVFNKYKLVSMNAFAWEGLPPGIEERHIEQQLFDRGKALFFRDPKMSYMVLEAQETGKLNPYGDHLSYRAIGLNYNKEYSLERSVLIENNKLRIPTADFVMFYTNKIVEAERTMDVNVKSNKTPIAFLCDDKDALTMKRIFQQIDSNDPAIFLDRSLNLKDVEVLDLKARFLGKELMDYKKSVENELLTFLGLNNIPQEKKERLITDEANSNNELISSFAELQLEARERACEAINEMFKLNIKVSRRQQPMENPVETVEETGGGADA